MIIQACLNGAREPDYHPRLPTASSTIARDGAACVAAGAAELHVHPRDAAGRETLGTEAFNDTIAALRHACPGTSLGVSTGEWIEGTVEQTIAAVEAWREIPDYASVNLSERGAPAVMAALWRRGIGVEAGLASVADAARLLGLGSPAHIVRVLIEIEEQGAAQAIAAADAIEAILSNGGFRRPRLLHGFEASVWPLVEHACRRRFSTRVGLEDGDKLPGGTTTPGHEALVRAAVERSRSFR